MNFATIFAASCVTLSVSIVGGLYVASKVERRIALNGSGGGSASERLWVATPPFTLIGTDGVRYPVVAVVSTSGKQEATRFCKYMPIVRDRLQRFASAVRVETIKNGQPALSGTTDALATELESTLGLRGKPRIEIVDGSAPVSGVIRKTPSRCEGKSLSS